MPARNFADAGARRKRFAEDLDPLFLAPTSAPLRPREYRDLTQQTVLKHVLKDVFKDGRYLSAQGGTHRRGTKVTLKYGDLFLEDANLLIGVNELFDGELGVPVSKNTVHGQLLVRNFGGSATAFRNAVDPQLQASGVQPTITTRAIQPNQAYPIGTTIKIPNGAHSAFLMAMARTDLVTSKASSDVPTLWCALKSALKVVHDHGNGEPLAMPLFGNGQAGVKLEPQHLLRLLVLALVDFATNSTDRLPKQVTIVLHETCFTALDIREIAQDWKK